MSRFTDIDRTIRLEYLIPAYRADLEVARADLERIERKIDALRDFGSGTPEELSPGIEGEEERASTLVRAYEKKLATLETEFRKLTGY